MANSGDASFVCDGSLANLRAWWWALLKGNFKFCFDEMANSVEGTYFFSNGKSVVVGFETWPVRFSWGAGMFV